MGTFSQVIVNWYRLNKRDLPWRDSSDPYLIWISEIILQQTRVAQGYAYFTRFIHRFPDLQSLADAPEDEVMKYWQGLGYYSRARNLHEAAKSMEGVFPRSYEGVLALKGVGEYTAAAICSAAYGLPYAVVDGNVYRVLSRYFGIETPIDSTTGKKLFKELANEVLDKVHPATYNQAIMDFGALQCTPQSPSCATCPFSDTCVALANGWVSKLPTKKNKVKTTNRYFSYIYVRTGAYTYISKRVGKDIWRNLYELPLIETSTPISETELLASAELQKHLTDKEEFTFRPLSCNIRHVLSHRVIHANFYELRLPEESCSFSHYQKVNIEDLEKYPVSKLIHSFFEKYVE